MLQPSQVRLKGSANLNLNVRIWRPTEKPVATVVICHGVNSHGGYYQWAAEKLVDHGYAVYALDLHGRGVSDGERFFVQDIADYVADVDAVVEFAKVREPGQALYLLGHSAGGVISSTYCLQYQHKLAGFICESFAFKVYAPDAALSVVKWLAGFAPRFGALKLKNRDFSRDPAIVKAMNDDPLIDNETQPAQTVAALARANDRLKQEFRLIKLPLMILHGTSDKATNPKGSQMFYDTAGSSDKTLKLYEGYAHDLLNDLGRERVMGDIVEWLGSRAIAASRSAA